MQARVSGRQDRKQQQQQQDSELGDQQLASTAMTPAHAAGVNESAIVESTELCVGPHSSREMMPEVTKDYVRQRLAFVSSYYPSAQPTRGCLKQVYNFFQQEKLLCQGP